MILEKFQPAVSLKVLPCFIGREPRGEFFPSENHGDCRFFQLVIKTYHHRVLSARGGDHSRGPQRGSQTVKSCIFVGDLPGQQRRSLLRRPRKTIDARVCSPGTPRLCSAKTCSPPCKHSVQRDASPRDPATSFYRRCKDFSRDCTPP